MEPSVAKRRKLKKNMTERLRRMLTEKYVTKKMKDAENRRTRRT